jgi:hypothetical protein
VLLFAQYMQCESSEYPLLFYCSVNQKVQKHYAAVARSSYYVSIARFVDRLFKDAISILLRLYNVESDGNINMKVRYVRIWKEKVVTL